MIEPSDPWADCPSPHLWNAHDGMATEVEVLDLLWGFTRALHPEYVVETGSHRGFGSLAIGRALKANGHGMLVSLEVDLTLAMEAAERVAGLPVAITLLRSLDFTPEAPIDLAWFDSETNIRVAEFNALREYMHSRTVVGFHDTAPRHGYRPQLDALGIQLLDLPTPRGVTFGRIK